MVFGSLVASAAEDSTHIPGRLLAGLREGSDAEVVSRTLRLHRASVRGHLPPSGVAVLDVPEEYGDAIRTSLERTGLFTYVERDAYARLAGSPNDPKYPAQWHLPRIQAPQAWALNANLSTVTVAVIDSGVETTHPDLAAKLVPGWNFRDNNSDVSDNVGHGTAVAGALGAASDNAIGIAAVSWTARIMPLAVVAPDESAAYSDIAAAIIYAADHGAKVVNISISGTTSSNTLQAAVDYAWSKDVLIFAAAGNDAKSVPYYPAACNHVMAVAATDSVDHAAYFSNSGSWITLAAPGVSILTTSVGAGYGFWNGTSFASPIAAGVAALALAANPALTNAQLSTILEQTADDLGEPGRDPVFGYGRINALAAVSAAQGLAKPAPAHRRMLPR